MSSVTQALGIESQVGDWAPQSQSGREARIPRHLWPCQTGEYPTYGPGTPCGLLCLGEGQQTQRQLGNVLGLDLRKEGGPTHVSLCPPSGSWNEEGPEALSSQPELGVGVGVQDGHGSSYLPCQAQEGGPLLPFPRKSVPSPCAPAPCSLEMEEETGRAGVGLPNCTTPHTHQGSSRPQGSS